ncbi:MAG: hemerythrin domain-containing protein [Verrucomicrobiota bacterium]
MTATQVMEAEHRTIETVVKALGNLALAIEKGQPADAALLKTAVEFFRVYADKLHHGKEEALFFPMLVKRGVPPQGCPIGGLTHEHERGRALVCTLEESIAFYEQRKPGAQDSLVQTLRKIVNLYQNHIWKEDAMVFPMADKILTEADQKELSGKFAGVDRSVGLEIIARLERFAKDLAPAAMQSSASNATPSGGCGCGCSST